MGRRPYANDWERINDDTEYSKSLNRYWHKGRIYDQLSASHNGIVGVGATLKQIVKESNGE